MLGFAYAQVQNLAVITGYYGFDPEVSSNGGDSGRNRRCRLRSVSAGQDNNLWRKL